MLYRVPRVFSVHIKYQNRKINTERPHNVPNVHKYTNGLRNTKMAIKDLGLPNISIHIPSKKTKIGIFVVQIYNLATLVLLEYSMLPKIDYVMDVVETEGNLPVQLIFMLEIRSSIIFTFLNSVL
jgi:hypothetical protein